MRVFVIVGLLLITLSVSASTKDRSVEQSQNDDAQKMVVLVFYHHAIDRVCDTLKTDSGKDDCVRAHWALWREVYILQKHTGLFNYTFRDFCRRFMLQVRDHMLKYQPGRK